MRWARWLPLIVGSIAIFILAGMLAFEDPSPGPLAAPHASLMEDDSLPGCTMCHAEDGGDLTSGCLGCHTEIASQLHEKRGFHFALLEKGKEPACAACHPDHHGADFELVGALAWGADGRQGFEHSHVEFKLAGAHAKLDCDACHRREGHKPFALARFPDHPRAGSYLGLDQDCASCHENVHGGERYASCAECHTQDAFRPTPGFDHGKLFPLDGAHEGVACAGCHAERPGDKPPVDFTKVKGKTCAACHETPHRVQWAQDCAACHPRTERDWRAASRALTPEIHAETRFSLRKPHDKVACESCHKPAADYAVTFLRADLDPAPGEDPPVAREDRCAACHEDVHAGQFGSRPGLCLDCHGRERFEPNRYDPARHPREPLAGAHAKVACDRCHLVDPATGVRRFVGTTRACRDCHDDVHDGQFAAQVARDDCAACHDSRKFLPATYGMERHDTFALRGAHRAVSCRACHRVPPAAEGEPVPARRFVGTARTCRECHADPHAGQFDAQVKKGDCTSCHAGDASTFRVADFDHTARTRYPLRGAHAKATCAQCHASSGDPPVVRYRDAPQDCAACHTDVHRGQFREGGTTRCNRCHLSDEEWKPVTIDHDATRFPLDGSHRKVSCDACHPAVSQPDGARVVQYRPLGRECRSCHDFDSR